LIVLNRTKAPPYTSPAFVSLVRQALNVRALRHAPGMESIASLTKQAITNNDEILLIRFYTAQTAFDTILKDRHADMNYEERRKSSLNEACRLTKGQPGVLILSETTVRHWT
jgi:hypothetical protein